MTSVSLRVLKRWPRDSSSARSSPEVVDLAVEDHLHGAVFVAQRLVAAREVDDRQPLVRERADGAGARRQNDLAGLVGPAMTEQRRHRRSEAAVLDADVTGDPAHAAELSPRA